MAAPTSVTAVSLDKLEAVFAEMDTAGIKYGLGAKAPYLDIDPGKISAIDCSGFVRYAIYKATDGKLKIPDGSQVQREWCEKARLKNSRTIRTYWPEPGVASTSLSSNRGLTTAKPLVTCASLPSLMETLHDTMESYSGIGVDARRWGYLTLKRQVY